MQAFFTKLNMQVGLAAWHLSFTLCNTSDRRIMQAEMIGDFSLPVTVLLNCPDDRISSLLPDHLPPSLKSIFNDGKGRITMNLDRTGHSTI
jgi:hypothetical protein